MLDAANEMTAIGGGGRARLPIRRPYESNTTRSTRRTSVTASSMIMITLMIGAGRRANEFRGGRRASRASKPARPRQSEPARPPPQCDLLFPTIATIGKKGASSDNNKGDHSRARMRHESNKWWSAGAPVLLLPRMVYLLMMTIPNRAGWLLWPLSSPVLDVAGEHPMHIMYRHHSPWRLLLFAATPSASRSRTLDRVHSGRIPLRSVCQRAPPPPNDHHRDHQLSGTPRTHLCHITLAVVLFRRRPPARLACSSRLCSPVSWRRASHPRWPAAAQLRRHTALSVGQARAPNDSLCASAGSPLRAY
jgi:hypothetical protein